MTFDDRTEGQGREDEDTFPAENEKPTPPGEMEETGLSERSKDKPPVSQWMSEPWSEESTQDTKDGLTVDDTETDDVTPPADEQPSWLRDFNGETIADEAIVNGSEYEPAEVFVDAEAKPHEEFAPPVPSRRKTAPVVTTISVVLLCLGLVALTWWGLRQHNERRLMEETLETALLGLGAEVPEHMQADVEGIRARLKAGDFEAAGNNLRMVMSRLQGRREGMAEATGGAPMPGRTDEGDGGEPIPESAYDDLPPDAATFFRQREPLFRQFLLMCAHARELKEQGVDVEPLRQVRDATIEAARLGQEQAVLQHMERFQQMLDSTDGGPQQGPTPQMQQKFAQFQELVAEAQRTNRDPRQAFNLMSRADEAARGGDMQAAERLIDQAIVAIRRAPAMQGGAPGGQSRGMTAGRGAGTAGDMMARRGAAGAGGREMMPQGAGGGREMMPGRGAPMGDDGGMQAMLRNLFSLVSMEERNLQYIWQNLQDAYEMLGPTAVLESSAANLRQLVENALAQMQEVSQRRHEFSAMIEGGPQIGQTPARPQGGRRPQDADAGQAADQQQRQFQEMLQIVTAHVDEMLEYVREMSPEEFEEYRERLVQSLIGAVLDPQALVEAKKAEPTPEQLQKQREELIRTKLRAAAPEFYKRKNAGEDVDDVEELFASSRGALYAGMLNEADEYVNDALKMLGLLPDELITDTTRPPAGGPAGFEAAPGLNIPPGESRPFGGQPGGRGRLMSPEAGAEGDDGPRLRYSQPGFGGQRPGGRGRQETPQ